MSSTTKTIKNWLVDSFPAPSLMMMPAAALDISPNSVKYLDAQYTAIGCLPGTFNEAFLPEGTIVDGAVQDRAALISALKELQEKGGHSFAFVAIPENALYLYTLQLAGRLSDAAIIQQIEFSFKEHVPLPLSEAIYDFDRVGVTRTGTIVSVTVAPRVVIEDYQRVLSEAGFTTRAIELEAYAVARSISASGTGAAKRGIEMIVDIGYSRAGIMVTKNGLPIFSITIPGGSQAMETVLDECKKQYAFWDTRTNAKGKRIERIMRVLATGGTSRELVAPLGKAIGREVELANVWQNLFSSDNYISAIDARDAQAMATLAGLLLLNKA